MAELHRRRALAIGATLALAGTQLACCHGIMKATEWKRSLGGEPVHTEVGWLRRQFPELGRIVEAHWQELYIGGGGIWWLVPGPRDVLFQAIIVLDRGDLERITAGYRWGPPRDGWDRHMTDELRPFAPADGDWRHSALLEADVHAPIYTGGGDVIVEMKSGTVYLNLIVA